MILAIYHLMAKILKRAEGRNAVAAAAYRSGPLLHEESTGITQDYSRKKGVEHTEILASDGAPTWLYDRQTPWNSVEAAEKRRDARVARAIEVGLPIELTNNWPWRAPSSNANSWSVARPPTSESIAIIRATPMLDF